MQRRFLTLLAVLILVIGGLTYLYRFRPEASLVSCKDSGQFVDAVSFSGDPATITLQSVQMRSGSEGYKNVEDGSVTVYGSTAQANYATKEIKVGQSATFSPIKQSTRVGSVNITNTVAASPLSHLRVDSPPGRYKYEIVDNEGNCAVVLLDKLNLEMSGASVGKIRNGTSGVDPSLTLNEPEVDVPQTINFDLKVNGWVSGLQRGNLFDPPTPSFSGNLQVFAYDKDMCNILPSAKVQMSGGQQDFISGQRQIGPTINGVEESPKYSNGQDVPGFSQSLSLADWFERAQKSYTTTREKSDGTTETVESTYMDIVGVKTKNFTISGLTNPNMVKGLRFFVKYSDSIRNLGLPYIDINNKITGPAANTDISLKQVNDLIFAGSNAGLAQFDATSNPLSTIFGSFSINHPEKEYLSSTANSNFYNQRLRFSGTTAKGSAVFKNVPITPGIVYLRLSAGYSPSQVRGTQCQTTETIFPVQAYDLGLSYPKNQRPEGAPALPVLKAGDSDGAEYQFNILGFNKERPKIFNELSGKVSELKEGDERLKTLFESGGETYVSFKREVKSQTVVKDRNSFTIFEKEFENKDYAAQFKTFFQGKKVKPAVVGSNAQDFEFSKNGTDWSSNLELDINTETFETPLFIRNTKAFEGSSFTLKLALANDDKIFRQFTIPVEKIEYSIELLPPKGDKSSLELNPDFEGGTP